MGAHLTEDEQRMLRMHEELGNLKVQALWFQQDPYRALFKDERVGVWAVTDKTVVLDRYATLEEALDALRLPVSPFEDNTAAAVVSLGLGYSQPLLAPQFSTIPVPLTPIKGTSK